MFFTFIHAHILSANMRRWDLCSILQPAMRGKLACFGFTFGGLSCCPSGLNQQDCCLNYFLERLRSVYILRFFGFVVLTNPDLYLCTKVLMPVWKIAQPLFCSIKLTDFFSVMSILNESEVFCLLLQHFVIN